MQPQPEPDPGLVVERVQTGVRIERRMVKVLKALAEYHDLSLGDLLEGIVLHAFEGRSPFPRSSLETISKLKGVYGMTYGIEASHRLIETAAEVTDAQGVEGAADATDAAGNAAAAPGGHGR